MTSKRSFHGLLGPSQGTQRIPQLVILNLQGNTKGWQLSLRSKQKVCKGWDAGIPKEMSGVCWDWGSSWRTQWNRKRFSESCHLSGEHQKVSIVSQWSPQFYLTFGGTEVQRGPNSAQMSLGIQFPRMEHKPFLENAKAIYSSLLTPWFFFSAEVIPLSSYFFSQMSWLFGDSDRCVGETLQRRLPTGLIGIWGSSMG